MEGSLEQPEIVVIKFDPEGSTFQMFEPLLPEKAVPVLADPASDRPFSEISPRFLTLNPLVPLGLYGSSVVDAQSNAGLGQIR
ncbi:hypothetical protein P12x_003892 [Tundrisphaera lichenicola]|uniref:hypothetical protein n=1 Tax=Tundrisphaera lichenicola TaxID=2029860 RepID=UPI003EBEAE58